MIDWMNPSDDVLDARRIGYQEAMQECAENAESLRAELRETKVALGLAHDTEEVLVAKLADANSHHVDLQRHRDAWRRYAYGRGERPQDFLDGNMVPSDRGPTRIEELERILDDTIGIDNISFTHEQIDAAWEKIDDLQDVGLRIGAYAAYRELGIVACEECGGSGDSAPMASLKPEVCPSCHGHGWVIK